MAHVVAVHGIGKTYDGPQSMAAEWVPALLDGFTYAGGGLSAADDIACVFYGDLFRGPGRMKGADDLTWLEPESIDDDGEVDLLAAWWQRACKTDPAVARQPGETLGRMASVQAALAALSNSHFLAGTTDRLLVFWLRQVRAYFAQPRMRELIQQRFAAAIGPDTEVVVAHSLGSVVAYEGLCANPQWQVRAFVTLGSPLAVDNVILDRLIPAPRLVAGRWRGVWPGQVRSWINIVDKLDFVALNRLSPVFGKGVVDVEIDNRVRMHDVRRYLTATETGRAIVAGCRDSGNGPDE